MLKRQPIQAGFDIFPMICTVFMFSMSAFALVYSAWTAVSIVYITAITNMFMVCISLSKHQMSGISLME